MAEPVSAVRGLGRRVLGWLRAYLMAAGAAATLGVVWLLSPLPLLVEEGLAVNERPARADAIVCLSSGSVQGLPSAAGWRRIVMAVRLHKDGFAPLIVFSGGTGSADRSEAEIYAEAALSLGLPADAVRLETRSESTAEHPLRVAELDEIRAQGGSDCSLLIVTSPYHGRRTRAVFRKAGFTRARIITSYGVRAVSRGRQQPRTLDFGQRGVDRLYRLIVCVREWTALGYYKLRGWV